MRSLAGTDRGCLTWSTLLGAALVFAPAFAEASADEASAEGAAADEAPSADPQPKDLVSGEYYRAEPIPVSGEYLSDVPPEPQAAASGTLFINFDGAQLSPGTDDAPNNITQMPVEYAVLDFPAYGDGTKRAATYQAVKKDWAAFDVLITDKRPQSGPYQMCMTGPGKGDGLPNNVLGIAPLDCNDAQASNVVYAFHTANDQFPASTQATTISQELAHAFGLEHVSQQSDIMNPFNADGDPAFLDECFNVDPGVNGIYCGAQHAPYCGGDESKQNSYQELLGFFGPAAPDLEPPTVSITYPNNGEVFEEGVSFTITVDASDDLGLSRVVLSEGGKEISSDVSEPFEWPAQKIPPGTYSFVATAFDNANNQTASSAVMITVNPAGASTSGTSGGSGTGDSNSGTSDASGTSDSGGGTGGDTEGGTSGDDSAGGLDDTGDDGGVGASSALPPGYGESGGGDEGCSIPRRSAGGLALFLLPLLARRRRRRS